MRILFVSSTFLPAFDGFTRVVYDQARKLVEMGHEIYLITRQYGETPRYEVIDGIKVYRVKPLIFSNPHTFIQWKLTLLSLGPMYYLQAIKKLMHTHFDLIHAFGTIPALAGILGKVVFKAPLVISLLGIRGIPGTWTSNDSISLKFTCMLEAWALSFILKIVDKIIIPSLFYQSIFTKIFGLHLSNKTEIIPNAVDTSRFVHEPHKHKGPPRVLFVGVLTSRKGVDVLIKAVPKVLEKMPDTKFLIIGGAAEPGIMQFLVKLASDYNVKQAVHFVRRVDDKHLLKYYSAADVFVLPSFFEASPLVVVEAMAMGVPVISTRCGAIPDIIDEKAGILVERGNVKQLSDAIIKVLSTPELREEMGKRGIEIVKQKYSLDFVVQQTQEMYRTLHV